MRRGGADADAAGVLKAAGERVRASYAAGGLNAGTRRLFRGEIYRYFRAHGRDFEWRRTRDPYRILVSEFMLQQTQVERVQERYPLFLEAFPDLATLAGAGLRDVLSCWQGLGYNRRAKSLWETARVVVKSHRGNLPESREELLALPGVGEATAGALAAYAHDRPALFVETNIRRVFLHFFFPGESPVRDRALLPLLEKSLDRRSPRRWYYALMDYGSMLRRHVPNPNRKSAGYRRQPPFEGSDRQVRSSVLRALVRTPGLTTAELAEESSAAPARAKRIVDVLRREGFLVRRRGRHYIA